MPRKPRQKRGKQVKTRFEYEWWYISLDKDCVEKLKPYVEKHSGNFGTAVREIFGKVNSN
jgi:hypothetical protein